MLGWFMRSIVGLGLERLLVVFNKYRVPSHLLLHSFRVQLGSERGYRSARMISSQKMRLFSTTQQTPTRLVPIIADRVGIHDFRQTQRSNGPSSVKSSNVSNIDQRSRTRKSMLFHHRPV
jgi:hypothetical protein